MVSIEIRDKLKELNIIDNIDQLSDEELMQAIIDKLEYYSNLVTPGLLKIVAQHQKVKDGKLAWREDITGEKCRELYHKYKSMRMVANKLGVSVSTVRKRLVEVGELQDNKK